MTKKEQLLSDYINLAKKLNKLPSFTDCAKFNISKDRIRHYFSNLGELKALAIETDKTLEDYKLPLTVALPDVHAYRLQLEEKNTKKQNKNAVQVTDKFQYIEQFSANVFNGKIKPVKPYKGKKNTDRILSLVLSDLHIGSDIKSVETGIADFGTKEEARRLAALTQQVIEYKPQYRDTTELDVLLLGDIIQGRLHDPADGAPIAEQTCRAIHLLTQVLSHLAANFKKVRVRCISGNHDRSTARHHNRAVNQKWDSYHTIIAYALKSALSAQKNVEFYIPKTPYGVYEVFGQKILFTHGDTVLKPGFPSSSIQIKNLEGQINKINASLHDKEEYKVCIVGHVHTASQTFLNNGTVMITNGALVEPDEFSVSIGIMESQNGQMLFESVPGFAVGDTRFIRVGRTHDKDASLDSIIKPWEGLES